MIRTAVAAIALVVALAAPGAATATPEATVTAVNYLGGSLDIDVILAIPRGVDTAARQGRADFTLRVSLTYVSVNDTIETLDSGSRSIGLETILLAQIDEQLVSVRLTVPLGTMPAPNQSPNFSATAELLLPQDVADA